uniref:Alkylated DNA repair protein AlkB homologue 8 N-terminal domain-containing protein n=1 Tax=Oreochromis aureus TaxID=47969 RepID=A0AAZ1XEE6_OREAU
MRPATGRRWIVWLSGATQTTCCLTPRRLRSSSWTTGMLTHIHPPIHIKGTAVERVSSFKFLGVHISEDLIWTTNCSKLVKKAHQCLFFLRTLRENHLSSDILVNFYRCTIDSILTNCITVWYGNCSASDRKALQRIVKTAQRITGAPLPAIKDIYRKRCLKRAGKIIKDPSHPAHGVFTLLPSGRRYRSLRTKTTRRLVSTLLTSRRTVVMFPAAQMLL